MFVELRVEIGELRADDEETDEEMKVGVEDTKCPVELRELLDLLAMLPPLEPEADESPVHLMLW